MGERLFQVPLSQGEIAQDQLAYERWLAAEANGDDPVRFTVIEPVPKNEKRLDRKRGQWIAEAKRHEAALTAELQIRILRQRAQREGSPILFAALQDAIRARDVRIARRRRGGKRTGRPQTTLRRIALATGAATYETMPCKKCGATTRFAKSRACVTCVHRRYQQRLASTDKAALRAEWSTAKKRQRTTDPTFYERKRAADRRYHKKKRAAP
jgi:hypothetical protein